MPQFLGCSFLCFPVRFVTIKNGVSIHPGRRLPASGDRKGWYQVRESVCWHLAEREGRSAIGSRTKQSWREGLPGKDLWKRSRSLDCCPTHLKKDFSVHLPLVTGALERTLKEGRLSRLWCWSVSFAARFQNNSIGPNTTTQPSFPGLLYRFSISLFSKQQV